MGKKATFTKSRFQGIRQQKRQREQRSVNERVKRRGIDEGGRLVQRVVVQKDLPSAAEEDLLFRQITQACRLPFPSKQLCNLIRSLGEKDESASEDTSAGDLIREKGEKKNLKTTEVKLHEIVETLIQTQNVPVAGDDMFDMEDGSEIGETEAAEGSDPMTIFQEIMRDECGCAVLSTLLSVLHSSKSSSLNEILNTIVSHFEEEDDLLAHHTACRLASAVVEYGDAMIRERILLLFQQKGSTVDGLQTLLADRHTAKTIERMIRCGVKDAVQWICEVIGLSAKKKSTKSSKREELKELLWKLIDGPVSGQVIQALIAPETRGMLLQHVSVSKLSSTKRGVSFLTSLFAPGIPQSDENQKDQDTPGKKSSELGWVLTESEAHTLVSQLIDELSSKLESMCVDEKANFLLQQIFHLVTLSGAHAEEHFANIYGILEKSIPTIANHGIGVHVIASFIHATGQAHPKISEKIAAALIDKSNVTDVLTMQHGSQIVRKLIPFCVAQSDSSPTGKLIKNAIEKNMDSLVYDKFGNLVVQDFLKTIDYSSFFRSCSKENKLISMCQDQYASRVIYCLLEIADPTTLTALCNLLKPSALSLSRHLNGRFIVEKAIASSKDIRNMLVNDFKMLAFEKGAQHVLCSLMSYLDQRGKRSLVERVIIPLFEELAVHQSGTIVLQKLMQQETLVLEGIQNKLRTNERLKNELAQNFFGKFVVQIALQQTR